MYAGSGGGKGRSHEGGGWGKGRRKRRTRDLNQEGLVCRRTTPRQWVSSGHHRNEDWLIYTSGMLITASARLMNLFSPEATLPPSPVSVCHPHQCVSVNVCTCIKDWCVCVCEVAQRRRVSRGNQSIKPNPNELSLLRQVTSPAPARVCFNERVLVRE